MYLVVVLFVMALALINPRPVFTDLREAGGRLLLLLLGLLALPSLYKLARHLGGSRTTAVWAMGLLGVNIAWLLALRHSEMVTVLPLAVSLAVICYYRLLEGHPHAWFWLGICLVAAGFCSLPVGLSLLIGVTIHAACWARGRETLTHLAWTALLLVIGATALLAIVPSPGAEFGPIALSGFLHGVLMLNAWLLPLAAVPLLLLALWPDPAARWRPSREVVLLALPLFSGLLVASCCRPGTGVLFFLGLLPLAVLWLAMGLARLQTRTPAWVWAPVGALLVATALPPALLTWGLHTRGHSPQTAQIILAKQHVPPAIPLVPLYAFVEQELSGEGLKLSN